MTWKWPWGKKGNGDGTKPPVQPPKKPAVPVVKPPQAAPKPAPVTNPAQPAAKPGLPEPQADPITEKISPSREDQREQTKKLIVALKKLDLEGIRTAVENGADLSVKNEMGWGAIVLAVNADLRGIVKYFIEKGAKPEETFNAGWTLLMFAAHYGKTNTAELLLTYNKIPVNAQSKFGETALMIAVTQGHKDMVEFLLNNGTDLTLKDNRGKTALMIATDKEKTEIAEMLKSAGAKE